MAETDKISQIKLPNNDTYNINDSYAIHKDGSLGDILYWSDNNTPTTLSGNTTTTRKFLRSVATTAGTAVAPAWDTIQSEDLPLALYNAKGAIKPAYTTTGTASLGTTSQAYSNSPTISSRTTTSSRFYALEADKNGVGYTNVPWTDKNLLQEYKAASGYTYWRPLLIGYSSGSTSSFTPSTATNQSYTFSTLLVQPSTGTIKAAIFDGNATTATKWASAQTAYVNLGNASTTTSIQGGSSNAAILGVNGILGTANGGTGFSSTVYVNSVVIGNSTTDTGALQTIRTGNGAFYATEEDGVPDFGTLPVAQGGTGRTSFTANEVVMSGSTTTSALTTRSITNNTSATAVTASTNLITANTLYYHTGNSNLTTVGTITTGTWNATTIDVSHGGTGITTSSYKNAIIAGNTSSATGAFSTIRTASGALYATAQDGAAQFGTLPVAQGGTNATSVTKFGIAYGNSSANGYTFTSAGSDGYILIGKGASTAPTWQQTLPVEHGGTGATSFTANCAIISGSTTTSALTTRAITNNTSATAVTASTNLITANTLYYHKGNSNIVTVGTITSGTWQGTAIAADYIGNHSTDKLTSGTLGTARGGTGVASHTANRLVYSTSATAIQATNKHYASDTQISINSNTAPDSGYALKVNGALETTNLINIITNSRTKDIYFSNGTPGSCSNVGRIMYDVNSATGITKSQFGFIEYSYPSTAGASALAYSENYYLPTANAGLGASVAYNILTDKAVTPFPIVGRQLPSSATLDTLTTPGVYAINNNLASGATFPSSQTHAKYGTLLHVAGLTGSTGAYNNAIQLWLSGITNSSNYRLFIRGHYYNSSNTWEGWAQIPLNIPNPPTTAGTYKLKVTVTNSVASYSWVSG